MIPVQGFDGVRVAVLGLGRSGLTAARALRAGGAEVVGWDDGESGRQKAAAEASRDAYQDALGKAGVAKTITTEIAEAPEFYYAEDYHQQYLAKNPGGYCGLQGTGVACPVGTGVAA